MSEDEVRLPAASFEAPAVKLLRQLRGMNRQERRAWARRQPKALRHMVITPE